MLTGTQLLMIPLSPSDDLLNCTHSHSHTLSLSQNNATKPSTEMLSGEFYLT